MATDDVCDSCELCPECDGVGFTDTGFNVLTVRRGVVTASCARCSGVGVVCDQEHDDEADSGEASR